MSFFHFPYVRSLPGAYPYRLEQLLDAIGIDALQLVNFAVLFMGAFTFLRYMSRTMFSHLVEWFASTVNIYDDDPLYWHILDWMMAHHPPNPRFCTLRAISKTKPTWDNDNAVLEILQSSKTQSNGRFISYRHVVEQPPIELQPFKGTHVFNHHGKWILSQHLAAAGSRNQLEQDRGHLVLQCLGMSTGPLLRLLKDAQSYNLRKNMTLTTVLRPVYEGGRAYWMKFNSRPSRDISSVILDKAEKEKLLNDINEFLHPRTRRWYSDHGIPYRRGYLFSGAPGMGKTSLTSALAGLFGLNIYVLSLLDPKLDESQLMTLMSNIPSRCIVLLEDVDVAGLGRRTIKDQPEAQGSPETGALTSPPAGTQKPATSISLSGLLNAIDGVASQEGRILIMTTNLPESLDPALIRPGRVDMHVDFQLPTRKQMHEFFVNMYSNASTSAGEKDGSATDLEGMASRFTASIPEKSVSLACLQGYLLQYKESPREASENATEWVKEVQRGMLR